MHLESQHFSNAVLITVTEPRIDASVAIQFKDAMRALTNGGPKRVILDLDRVEFLDSSGLGAVVASMKQLGEGQALELAGLSSAVEKVFRLTRLDSVFQIHPDAATAIEGLKNAS